ncbi:MAG: anaerobic ribonucleoside-triphosphate reductase activating protein [Thermodesulfobacteriota bacterium]
MPQDRQLEIKGFLETSFLDWPGEVASVLFLSGCNFRCPFCHNHELVLNHQAHPTLDWREIEPRLARFDGWIDGVVVSGGEPTLSLGLESLLRRIKHLGLKVKLDTNGSRPSVLRSLIGQGLVDHVAMDVKGPLDEISYARATGRPGILEPVLESLEILAGSSRPYTLRTTVVPGLHSEKDVLLLAEQLQTRSAVWSLQSFNPADALDCSFRRVEAWDQDYFEDLSRRARTIQSGAA